MSELAKRLSVAIFGIPTITLLTYLGGWYFFTLIVIISLVAQVEFYLLQRTNNIKPQIFNGLVAGAIILTGLQTQQFMLTGVLIILILMVIFAFEMFLHHDNVNANIGATLTGVFYIPLFLGLLMINRNYIDTTVLNVENAGFRFVMMLLLTIWICDTFAYAFGKKFGKHKLYEKVSPNKTFEGGVAGLIGAVLFVIMVKTFSLFPLNWLQTLMIGVTIGIVGQTGDLVESWFKRDAGVKDSSILLPGHGGMLDRFDSLIFLSPAMLLLTYLIF